MTEKGRKKIAFSDIINKAYEIFGDKDKALSWYLKECPEFENKTPYQYAKEGNQEKVFNFLSKIIYSTYQG